MSLKLYMPICSEMSLKLYGVYANMLLTSVETPTKYDTS